MLIAARLVVLLPLPFEGMTFAFVYETRCYWTSNAHELVPDYLLLLGCQLSGVFRSLPPYQRTVLPV